ncbi:MAG: hypothetical protein XD87_0312 [candidate division WS6 bacterium 36_33]|uniref:Uncharacterized protein n=1 Tax=candidate division WS6 bacterium 36_33 TaxID=1641388 RepID=A0A101GYR4_9BACT|nr:MAG: hypothetical protein XD87_0312 [candidate division WS6 bacterium 36_33]
MEKYTPAKGECVDRNEALRNTGKRIICDSLLLAAEIIEKNRNVWDLVRRGIVDNQNELVQCVGILLGMEIAKQKERTKEEDLVDRLEFTFGWRHQGLKRGDYVDIVDEYTTIREWLKDPNSKV